MRKGWFAGRVRTTRREAADALLHIEPGSTLHKVSVLTPEAFPTVADIARYRNLTVSAWAPAAALHSLLAEPHDIFLLGHRPGTLRNLATDTFGCGRPPPDGCAPLRMGQATALPLPDASIRSCWSGARRRCVNYVANRLVQPDGT